MPTETAPTLAEIATLLCERKLPPVDQWHPAHCGDSDMRIAADGTWFHGGTPIGRPELVRLFSTILRREADGGYVLVTPGEKLDIVVDDAPFVAVAVTSEGEGMSRQLAFRLNTGDHVVAGPDNLLRVETADDGTPRPYVHIRGGLDALVNRATFYELADWAIAEDAAPPGLWSGGVFFPFAA
ncbi:DUF1285 domain-containing protein [Glacieibacterium megasporae]|uniref:DUF1285 domain-containing protein n=1 Tax=Glacieibacterium megasporae TaxID=2835787 RepID=UPI001C1DFF5F|nr:DUF1285 domain-containing protein [Polymorphobacter megasporae]UAJ09300.1 DUF1285 domain-containing protein [Polymorphobacter megasporae]